MTYPWVKKSDHPLIILTFHFIYSVTSAQWVKLGKIFDFLRSDFYTFWLREPQTQICLIWDQSDPVFGNNLGLLKIRFLNIFAN